MRDERVPVHRRCRHERLLAEVAGDDFELVALPHHRGKPLLVEQVNPSLTKGDTRPSVFFQTTSPVLASRQVAMPPRFTTNNRCPPAAASIAAAYYESPLDASVGHVAVAVEPDGPQLEGRDPPCEHQPWPDTGRGATDQPRCLTCHNLFRLRIVGVQASASRADQLRPSPLGTSAGMQYALRW